ncbi:hypothetical protein [Solimicrobium silvestre]|uniref:Uncharacterized protein n=1 Tax=Solimicrobium silvestre TaxID=2099400 RepID=A0A2S9H2X0_9BURK|nr:hypothetical protein [Solimicrobium silvestre]PRC94318.1 hypothetical protein S2091_0939 [Solimicrobium silvestre]
MQNFKTMATDNALAIGQRVTQTFNKFTAPVKQCHALLVTVSMASLLSGCFINAYPAQHSLCQADALSNWKYNRVQSQLDQKEGRYFFSVRDESWNSKAITSGLLSGVYWIKLDGSPIPRDRGLPVMAYDPAKAYIEVQGKRIPAIPRIWTGAEMPETEVTLPVNFTHKTYFLAFPVTLDKFDTFRVGFGSAWLNGVEIPLPAYESCNTSVHFDWDFSTHHWIA